MSCRMLASLLRMPTSRCVCSVVALLVFVCVCVCVCVRVKSAHAIDLL